MPRSPNSLVLRFPDGQASDTMEVFRFTDHNTLKHQISPTEYIEHAKEVKLQSKKRKLLKSRIKRVDKHYIQEFRNLAASGSKEFIIQLIQLDILVDFSKKPCACGGRRSLQKYTKIQDKYVWKCNNYKCAKRLSIRTDASDIICKHPKLSFEVLFEFIFVHWWYMHTNDEINSELGLSEATIALLRSHLRTAITDEFVQNLMTDRDYKFGRNGIVEIDELVLKTYKVNSVPDESMRETFADGSVHVRHVTRFKKKTWIFGITERGENPDSRVQFYSEAMIASVPNYDGYLNENIPDPSISGRNAAEVDRILFPKLHQGASVMSDQHPMYLKLKTRAAAAGLNIEHNIINKSRDKYIIRKDGQPSLKIYTQSIENKWRLFRKILRKLNRIGYFNLPQVLREINWRISNVDHSYAAIIGILRFKPDNLRFKPFNL